MLPEKNGKERILFSTSQIAIAVYSSNYIVTFRTVSLLYAKKITLYFTKNQREITCHIPSTSMMCQHDA